MKAACIVVGAAAFLLVAGPALGDWEYTRWGMTPEQVLTDVILAAQPTKRFVTYEEHGRFGAVFADGFPDLLR